MSLRRPSRREAWQRLSAAEPPEWVLRHCRCVEGLAAAMARCADRAGHDVDVELVALGALLHDIGRSLSQGIDHAYRGADLLRQPPPLPEDVVRIVETHTGAGIPADQARAAGLPDRDYVPRTLEQKIVAHADNLFSGDKRLHLDQVLAKYDAKGLPAAGVAIALLHEELQDLLDVDLESLAVADLGAP